MINSIKHFGKLKFKQDDLFFGFLTLVDKLEGPSKAVMDRLEYR